MEKPTIITINVLQYYFLCGIECYICAAFGSVVQLDRMTDSGSVGCGFESRRGHQMGLIFHSKINPFFIYA